MSEFNSVLLSRCNFSSNSCSLILRFSNKTIDNIFRNSGYFVSCLASSAEVATALGAPLILPSLLFGGFFLNNGLVPVYLDWLRYLSWFMYSNEALSINQWDGLVIESSNATYTNSTASVLLNGDWVLKRFSFNVVS